MTKRNILIIDDNIIFTRMLKKVIEANGLYDVFQEHDAMKAVLTASLIKPDMIILDIVMPLKDGSIIAEELRHNSRTYSIPIIFISGLIGENEADTYNSLHADNMLLPKTTSVRQLLSRAETWISTQFKKPAQPSSSGTVLNITAASCRELCIC